MRTFWLSLAVVLIVLQAGCALPAGTNIQNSGVGLKVAPFGDVPQGPKLALGSFASSFSTPPAADSGPNLNRVQIRAPLGVDHTGTVASGPVGNEISKAGSNLTDVMKVLHPHNKSTLIPLELPTAEQIAAIKAQQAAQPSATPSPATAPPTPGPSQ